MAGVVIAAMIAVEKDDCLTEVMSSKLLIIQLGLKGLICLRKVMISLAERGLL